LRRTIQRIRRFYENALYKSTFDIDIDIIDSYSRVKNVVIWRTYYYRAIVLSNAETIEDLFDSYFALH